MPIRVRLTLWYLLILTIVLAAVATGIYAFVATAERQSVDRILRERTESFDHAYPNSAAIAEAAHDLDEDVFLYAPPGKLVSRSPIGILRIADARSIPQLRGAIDSAFAGRMESVTVGSGNSAVRCIAAPVAGGRYVFVSTESLAGRWRALQRLRSAFILIIPAALVIAAIGGYFLAARSLAPVAQMTAAASRIEAENLSDRIEVRNPSDELGQLGAVLNALLQRLERSFQQQKQLLADTSHELRTPVTIIRSEAEVTLSRERNAAEYRHALEVIRSESAHLTSLIEAVLLLARADAKQSRLAHEPFALADVIQQSIQSLGTIAHGKQIALSYTIDGSMPMSGDPELIRRMLLNLLDNGIKFTPGGGRVRLDAHLSGPQYTITISDTGSGIPSLDQERIFDRFFRVDSARSREGDRDAASGAGLGLAIARWIARAHGGDLRLLRSNSGGSVFQATLPIEANEAAA